MSSNPQLQALKEACHGGNALDIKAALATMQPQQVANYVKMALLQLEDNPEIWSVLPHIDPNMEMYGGNVLANTASHDLPGMNSRDFHEGLTALVHYGADPNATFHAVEAGEGVVANDVFSLAILSQVLKPSTFYSLELLLGAMCAKGLTLEATANSPSKVQQLTEALHPAKLLEKCAFDERERLGRLAQQQSVFTRIHRGQDAIEGVRITARSLYDTLHHAGADFYAPFTATADTKPEDLLNAADTLWSYRHALEEFRWRPAELKTWLETFSQSPWHQPEFVLDPHVLDNAICMYANLAAHLQTRCMQETFLPSDRSWRAGKAMIAGR